MKKLVWPGIIVLGIIILLGGVAGLTKAVFSTRFDAELTALKSKGEPTTLAELVGGPIAPERNAALPYMQIRTVIESEKHEADLGIIDEFASQKGPISAGQWKAAEGALSRTQPLRSLLDDALSRPQCRFEIDMQDPASTLYPHLMAIRRMSRWLRVDALVNARSGRMDRAADDICTQVGIAQSLKDEPFVIGHVMRMALMAVPAKTMLSAAEYGSLGEVEARHVFDTLGRFDFARSDRQGWRGERVMLLHYSDPRNAQQFMASASYSLVGSTSPAQSLGRPLASIYVQTAMKGDLAAFMRVATERMGAADLSYVEAVAKGLAGTPANLPSYAWLSKTLCPVYENAGLRRYQVETVVAQTRVFLALQAYRERNGAYPASLDQLRTRLGWKLPKDPFSGRDLIYRHQAKGFTLYSVGPDLKDDGGRPIPNESLQAGDTGDIVLTWDR